MFRNFNINDCCRSEYYAAEINRNKILNGNTANIFTRFLDLVGQKIPKASEVAFYARMNFYSQSHFSRFVKNMLEVSPTEYRNNFQHLLM